MHITRTICNNDEYKLTKFLIILKPKSRPYQKNLLHPCFKHTKYNNKRQIYNELYERDSQKQRIKLVTFTEELQNYTFNKNQKTQKDPFASKFKLTSKQVLKKIVS